MVGLAAMRKKKLAKMFLTSSSADIGNHLKTIHLAEEGEKGDEDEDEEDDEDSEDDIKITIDKDKIEAAKTSYQVNWLRRSVLWISCR